MIILDGKKIKEKVRADLKSRFLLLPQELKNKKLVILQVGDKKESTIYINNKIKFGESIGIKTELIKFPENISENIIVSRIGELNSDQDVGGIIVQLPLSAHLNKDVLLDSINLSKDVDGLSSANREALYSGEKAVLPATARAVHKIFTEYEIDLNNKKVAVLGRSNLVGKPTAFILDKCGGVVTVCHRGTNNIKEITKSSDIIVSATGNPRMINKDWISAGSVLVDVGITTDLEGKLSGDVDFNSVKDIVSAISPVPGGVGAVTVSMIFENFIDLILKK
jgi:methylenetetrahydrofolate dehydrogenase (NADP+)/methenyltetrahydrofolate cyclohydrolase